MDKKIAGLFSRDIRLTGEAAEQVGSDVLVAFTGEVRPTLVGEKLSNMPHDDGKTLYVCKFDIYTRAEELGYENILLFNSSKTKRDGSGMIMAQTAFIRPDYVD